jgi:hypothetical protein
MSPHAGRALAPILAPLALLAAGCATIEVHQQYDDGKDFAPYRTFALVPRAEMTERFGESRLSPAVQQRIEDALAHELPARGLAVATAAPADLAVAYFAGRRQGVDEMTYGQTYAWSGASGAQATDIHKELEEGWLVVDLVDVKTGKLVWRGRGQAELKSGVVEPVVKAILAQYPPQAK